MYAFSIDTYKPTVAGYIIKEGIDVSNDVNGVKGSNMASWWLNTIFQSL